LADVMHDFNEYRVSCPQYHCDPLQCSGTVCPDGGGLGQTECSPLKISVCVDHVLESLGDHSHQGVLYHAENALLHQLK
jgi:hypothetical protein